MKRRSFVFLLILTTVTFSGCITLGDIIYLASQPRFKAVKDQNKSFECNYYSAFPPEGTDWQYYQKDNTLMFLKKYNSYHTLIFGITPKKLPENLTTSNDYYIYIKNVLSKNINPERFKNLDNIVEPNNKFGKLCVKYHIKSEDHQIPVQTPKGFLIIEDNAFIFQHQTHKYTNFEIMCSERYDTDNNDPAVKELFIKFINKITIK